MVVVRSTLNTRILVAEEESPKQQRSIAGWLEDAGYGVATVEIGKQALKVMEQQDFDVAVVGVRLPGVTGVKMMRAASDRRLKSKPVIIIGYPLLDSAIEAVRLGIVDYLVGLQAPDDLDLLIRETLLQREGAQYIAGDNWWRA